MTKLDLGSFGVVLNVAADGAHRREAAELETLGYGTIWLPAGRSTAWTGWPSSRGY